MLKNRSSNEALGTQKVLWHDLKAVSNRGKSRQAQIFTVWLHFGSNKEDEKRQEFRAMPCRISR